MNKSKAWLVFGTALACIGCCAIPAYIVFSGISAAGIAAAIWSPQLMELALCLLPLLVLGWMYARYTKRQRCCDNPAKRCGSNQCSSPTDPTNKT